MSDRVEQPRGAATGPSGVPAPAYRRIATEEAFAPPEFYEAWARLIEEGTLDDPGFHLQVGSALRQHDPDSPGPLRQRMTDLGELRLGDMRRSGIDHQIIGLTAPGTQVFEPALGTSLATFANDVLADACSTHPDRFSGLAAVAPQDPAGAVAEIERAVGSLGLRGAIINSHTQGEYLDDQRFWPILEALEALDVPLYLHPTTPSKGLIQPLAEARLHAAIFGFAVETGMHVLRLILSGAFDRFPRLRLVVGHLGEGLPYWLHRLDYSHRSFVSGGRYEGVARLEGTPSEYLRRNVWVTTSGMAWSPAIRFAQEVLGVDRVLYAMDYPYQFEPDEVLVHEELPIDLEAKRALFQGNAERVFALPRGVPGLAAVPS